MYLRPDWITLTSPAQSPQPAQIFWVFFNLYSRLLESSGKMGQIDQNWGAEYEHFYFGRLKNHKITHLPPHFNMCKSISRVQLKIYNFFKLLCLIQLLTQAEALPAIFLLRCLSHVWVESHLSESNLSKKGDQKSMYLRHIPLFLIKWTLLAIDSDCLPKVCYLKVKKLRYLSKLR